MSLDNIQLPAGAIPGLFSKSLVVLNPEKPAGIPKKDINLLGKHGKGVFVLVDHETVTHLPDAELELLLNILSACKLSMDDAAVINLHHHPDLTYETLAGGLQAKVILMLGPAPEILQLPLSFPQYQVQRYANLTLLWSGPLEKMLTDRAEKTRLWHCLQQIF